MARRRVGVGGDDVDTGRGMLFVHAAHGEGVALQRRHPGQPGHEHAHALEPGADGTVEQEDFAPCQAPFKICVRAPITLPGPMSRLEPCITSAAGRRSPWFILESSPSIGHVSPIR